MRFHRCFSLLVHFGLGFSFGWFYRVKMRMCADRIFCVSMTRKIYCQNMFLEVKCSVFKVRKIFTVMH